MKTQVIGFVQDKMKDMLVLGVIVLGFGPPILCAYYLLDLVGMPEEPIIFNSPLLNLIKNPVQQVIKVGIFMVWGAMLFGFYKLCQFRGRKT